ncbi:43827_t:CDS:1, partial [Gigaspora margarita]
EAFEVLKEKLLIAPILVYSYFTRPFILLTDVSDLALEAILSQLNNNYKKVQ